MALQAEEPLGSGEFPHHSWLEMGARNLGARGAGHPFHSRRRLRPSSTPPGGAVHRPSSAPMPLSQGLNSPSLLPPQEPQPARLASRPRQRHRFFKSPSLDLPVGDSSPLDAPSPVSQDHAGTAPMATSSTQGETPSTPGGQSGTPEGVRCAQGRAPGIGAGRRCSPRRESQRSLASDSEDDSEQENPRYEGSEGLRSKASLSGQAPAICCPVLTPAPPALACAPDSSVRGGPRSVGSIGLSSETAAPGFMTASAPASASGLSATARFSAGLSAADISCPLPLLAARASPPGLPKSPSASPRRPLRLSHAAGTPSSPLSSPLGSPSRAPFCTSPAASTSMAVRSISSEGGSCSPCAAADSAHMMERQLHLLSTPRMRARSDRLEVGAALGSPGSGMEGRSFGSGARGTRAPLTWADLEPKVRSSPRRQGGTPRCAGGQQGLGDITLADLQGRARGPSRLGRGVSRKMVKPAAEHPQRRVASEAMGLTEGSSASLAEGQASVMGGQKAVGAPRVRRPARLAGRSRGGDESWGGYELRSLEEVQSLLLSGSGQAKAGVGSSPMRSPPMGGQAYSRRHSHDLSTLITEASKLRASAGRRTGSLDASADGGVSSLWLQRLEPHDYILGKRYEDVRSRFLMHKKELGAGQFGVVRKCKEITSGKIFACKTINKKGIRTVEDADDVRQEVACLTMLQPHPGIVGFRGAYEDKETVNIVMEFCRGGDLLDHVKANGPLTEPQAAKMCVTLVEALLHCHCLGIVHRDVKPENILLTESSADSGMKVVDFGVAAFHEPGVPLKEIIGTPDYMAPEMLLRNYGPKADVWSAGVVLYIALSAIPPFWASTKQSIAECILKEEVSFKSPKWAFVSADCKDLIMRMLTKDPRKRISASDVLKHPWIDRHADVSSLSFP